MYKIKLQHFEGPLDLLLFFIKRDEIDIYDIPISGITKDFMEYLHFIKQFDLEIAGDFILMASTLMQIKVRMLLPKEVDEEGEEIDPRTDLVNALLEYKRYKEVADELSYMETEQKKVSFRGNFKYDEIEKPPELDTLLNKVTIFDIMKAFREALSKRPKENYHNIRKINVSIEDQINYITDKVRTEKNVSFKKLITSMREKIRVIVTFIALLEMVKAGRIGLQESESFNDFVIFGTDNGQ